MCACVCVFACDCVGHMCLHLCICVHVYVCVYSKLGVTHLNWEAVKDSHLQDFHLFARGPWSKQSVDTDTPVQRGGSTEASGSECSHPRLCCFSRRLRIQAEWFLGLYVISVAGSTGAGSPGMNAEGRSRLCSTKSPLTLRMARLPARDWNRLRIWHGWATSLASRDISLPFGPCD